MERASAAPLADEMTRKLTLDDLENLAFDLQLDDMHFQSISTGVRDLISEAKRFGKFMPLISRLIVTRPDVDWLTIINGTTTAKNGDQWTMVLQLVNNNTSQIVEVRERVVMLEREIDVNELKRLVEGDKTLFVRPLRADVRRNFALIMTLIFITAIEIITFGIVWLYAS